MKKLISTLFVTLYSLFSFSQVTVLSGLDEPMQMVQYGTYVYVSQINGNKISKFDISLSSPVLTDVVTGLDGPTGMAIKDDFLFFSQTGAFKVSKIDLTSSSPSPVDVLTSIVTPVGLVFNGDDLYIASVNLDKVVKYNIITGTMTDVYTSLNAPVGLFIDNGFIYISRTGGLSIADLNNPALLPVNYVTNLTNPGFMTKSCGSLVVPDISENKIVTIDASSTVPTPNPTLVDVALNLNVPVSVLVIGGDLYFCEQASGQVRKVSNVAFGGPTGVDVLETCDSLQWIDGVVYYTDNNTATHVISGGASNGCDSTVLLNLTISSTDLSVAQSGTTLTANAQNATYQWLDCSDSTLIPNEVNQSFTGLHDESYAAIITNLNGGCIDTTSCYAAIGVGVDEYEFETQVRVYPNPVEDNFKVDLGKNYESVNVVITDVRGVNVIMKNFGSCQFFDMDLDIPSGVYFVNIKSSEATTSIRLIKN
ncbi:MAG: T9SS type A sorting domain-containing protein [Lishizhenia sp.]